jgi:hypothetical protein
MLFLQPLLYATNENDSLTPEQKKQLSKIVKLIKAEL